MWFKKYLSIPKLQWCNRWSLRMDQIIHISKSGPYIFFSIKVDQISSSYTTTHNSIPFAWTPMISVEYEHHYSVTNWPQPVCRFSQIHIKRTFERKYCHTEIFLFHSLLSCTYLEKVYSVHHWTAFSSPYIHRAAILMLYRKPCCVSRWNHLKRIASLFVKPNADIRAPGTIFLLILHGTIEKFTWLCVRYGFQTRYIP